MLALKLYFGPKRARTAVITSFLGCALMGCALTGLGGRSSPPETYDLQASPVRAKAPLRSGLQLVVREPVAIRALEKDRILIKPEPDRISYFANAVWSDRLPRLVQARLIEVLENSGSFRAVGRRGDKINGDFLITTDLRAFQIEMRESGAEAHIILFLKIITPQGQVLASRLFETHVPAKRDDVGAGVEALNRAMQTTLKKIVAWSRRFQNRSSH